MQYNDNNIPELYNTFLYDKVIVGADGHMERSDYPLECFLGWNWKYIIFHQRAAVAYCPSSYNEPLNLYWESARGRSHGPIKGTVVLFRHHAHMRMADVYPGFKALPPKFRCAML